jgi:peptidoglycan/xylan/chitin deacetylase (PgdA/CDA1 family)
MVRASAHGRHHFERLFAEGANPWGYDTAYERTKYEQTLSLLPARAERALELACAEGHFTVMLAPRATELVAADISEIALDRVADRCARAGLTNVTTRRLDLTRDALPGDRDLILCCEVLYFMGDRGTLAAVAKRIAGALAEGGALVVAHAHLLSDDPGAPGFDWGLPFGARIIGETFAALPELALEHEIRTPLYRIQRFRRRSASDAPRAAVIDELPNAVLPEGRTTTGLRLAGSSAPMPASTAATTSRLSILMYHRVATGVPPERRRYAVDPAQLDEQLAYLREAEFTSVSVEEWRDAVHARRPLPGRRVLITFDDAYEDFGTSAWPLLARYGFSAMLFVVTGSVGRRNSWDRAGSNERLLDWDALRSLARDGVSIGSHTVSHPRLSAHTAGRIVEEAARSRLTMIQQLGAAPTAIAYPWGGFDETVQHLVGACGYTEGFTTRSESARFEHSLMALPRLEVRGDSSWREFIALLDA